jgi:MFS family permease
VIPHPLNLRRLRLESHRRDSLPFLTAQFLGATNDNAFKITLILFLLSIVRGEARQVRYSSLATALFPIPFLLFSPMAGFLADRFPKQREIPAWTFMFSLE